MLKNLYLIIGRSGSGKITLVENLNKKYGFIPIESYTTRPKRKKNESGHIFVSPQEFKKLGKIYTHNVYDGNEYGVTKELLDTHDLFVVEVSGATELKYHYDGKSVKILNLICSEEELRKRMKARGDADENIERRIREDRIAFVGASAISDVEICVDYYTPEALAHRIYKWIMWEEKH